MALRDESLAQKILIRTAETVILNWNKREITLGLKDASWDGKRQSKTVTQLAAIQTGEKSTRFNLGSFFAHPTNFPRIV